MECLPRVKGHPVDDRDFIPILQVLADARQIHAKGNATIGRNTLTGPGLVSSDLSLIKVVPLPAKRTAQIRLEAFNFLNRANFAVPSGRVAFTNAAGDVAPNWGRITSTVTTSQQIQLGGKYLSTIRNPQSAIRN